MFFESLEPEVQIEDVHSHDDHHHDDQEAQECPPSGDLEDLVCLDGYFVTVTPHMTLFWNP